MPEDKPLSPKEQEEYNKLKKDGINSERDHLRLLREEAAEFRDPCFATACKRRASFELKETEPIRKWRSNSFCMNCVGCRDIKGVMSNWT